MRRFIDVVFIEPKAKKYVILHQGEFWQLPRMNLSKGSWVFRLLYEGELKDIFVAKDQAITCEHLAKILKTRELPLQLHGMDANRFLDWWEMNDYKWTNQDNLLILSDNPSTPPQKPLTLQSSAWENKAFQDKPKATPAPAPQKTQLNADAILHAKQQAEAKLAKAQTTQMHSQQQIKTTTIDQSPTDDSLDIFDQLLQQLNDEVIH